MSEERYESDLARDGESNNEKGKDVENKYKKEKTGIYAKLNQGQMREIIKASELLNMIKSLKSSINELNIDIVSDIQKGNIDQIRTKTNMLSNYVEHLMKMSDEKFVGDNIEFNIGNEGFNKVGDYDLLKGKGFSKLVPLKDEKGKVVNEKDVNKKIQNEEELYNLLIGLKKMAIEIKYQLASEKDKDFRTYLNDNYKYLQEMFKLKVDENNAYSKFLFEYRGEKFNPDDKDVKIDPFDLEITMKSQIKGGCGLEGGCGCLGGGGKKRGKVSKVKKPVSSYYTTLPRSRKSLTSERGERKKTGSNPVELEKKVKSLIERLPNLFPPSSV